LHFDEIKVVSTFYWTNILNRIIIVQAAHWNNNPREDMSLHTDALFCFRTN
jgi:hypothetical protein